MKLGVASIVALLCGCGGQDVPRRDCFARVWTDSAEQRVVGSWNDWGNAVATQPHQSGKHLLRMTLPAGEYGYMLRGAEGETLDPRQPLTTFDGDREVSRLEVHDCAAPALSIEEITRDGDHLRLRGRFLASAKTGAPLEPTSIVVTTQHGDALFAYASTDGWIEIEGVIPVGQSAAKMSIDLSASDVDGLTAQTHAASWAARDERDALVYQVMVDRFRGDGGDALAAPDSPGSRAGGSLDGVQSALDNIVALGADTLWLSPVYLGPDDAHSDSDGHVYEGYHGYWPLESRTVEPRFGGEPALDSLMEETHRRGIGVVLDLVPNHVYEDNARYSDNPAWFGDGDCLCGSPTCSWHENIERCWFTSYLPDVQLKDARAMQAAVDDAMWWTQRFDLDGVRIDAVPMMPRVASRRIAAALREHDEGALVLGEIYTGPGNVAVDQLRHHLGPNGLDAAFDFPLMWAMHDVIGRGSASFSEIETLLLYQEQTIGQGSLLARIVDNHDTPRFVSVAHGDAGGDPWSEPAEQPVDDAPYLRLRLALATIMTLPGIPVIYQGDEIGLAGAGDPDNRRVMPADDVLNDAQLALRATVQQLGQLRRCSVALRRGTRQALLVGGDRYAYRRDHDGSAVVVVMSTSNEPASFTLPAGSLETGVWQDILSGESIDVDGGVVPIRLPPLGVRILLPGGSACANP
jgi:glycosidase